MKWDDDGYHNNGDCEWWMNGRQYHREDGPAFIGDGGKYQSWWINGKRHRLDGPALINGDTKHWYVDHKLVPCETQEEFERMLRLKAFW